MVFQIEFDFSDEEAEDFEVPKQTDPGVPTPSRRKSFQVGRECNAHSDQPQLGQGYVDAQAREILIYLLLLS